MSVLAKKQHIVTLAILVFIFACLYVSCRVDVSYLV